MEQLKAFQWLPAVEGEEKVKALRDLTVQSHLEDIVLFWRECASYCIFAGDFRG
jgi:hypothetical protein